jgi:type I restriction enzyme S subunit
VTKGLDAGVQMKDSGIEWIGHLPQGWKIVPFRVAAWFQEGPGIMAADFREEGVPLLRISGVQGEFASLYGCNYLDPEKVATRWHHFKTELGDLLISASATTGTISEVDDATVGSVPYTGIIRLKTTNRCHKPFLKAFLGSQAFFEQIALHKAGSTIQHFGPTHLSRMRIVLPPIEEQVRIASYLTGATSRIGTMISKVETSIELLREHRTALITAAVTGKIDFRNAA